MKGRVASVIVLACATCAACSLFLDTGDLTGTDANANDGGAAADGSADAADGAVAAADASRDGDAGPVPCPDGGFCDSFERATLVGDWGDVVDNGKGCALTIDPLATAGASSLKLFVPETFADDCQIFLAREFPNLSPAEIALSFDLRVGALVDREVQIAGIREATPDRGLYFVLVAGALRIAEQQYGNGGSFNSLPVVGLEPARWYHVALVHEPASKHTTVDIDGTNRVDTNTSISFEASGVGVFVGDTFSRAGSPAEVWFDDFRFEPTF